MMSVGPVYTAFFEEGLAGFAFGSASMASRAFSPLAAAGSVVLFQTSGAAGVVAGAGVVVEPDCGAWVEVDCGAGVSVCWPTQTWDNTKAKIGRVRVVRVRTDPLLKSLMTHLGKQEKHTPQHYR